MTVYNIPDLLRDNGVQLDTEGKNVAVGWVQMKCFACDDPSNHLGYNLEKHFFSCWKCGTKQFKPTISALLNISQYEVNELLKQYKERPQSITETDKPKRPTILQLPNGSIALSNRHRLYLWQRDFDPDILTERYNLYGTGHLGSYKFRIIIPVFHKGEMVSYLGRDITDKSDLRYKACTSLKEVRPHKDCLYGLDDVKGDSVVLVEGPADVWRLGQGAVAQFGMLTSIEQLKLLKRFKRRYIMLDSGENEFRQSKKLAAMLSGFSGENVVVEMDSGDPASMTQEDANALMARLGF